MGISRSENFVEGQYLGRRVPFESFSLFKSFRAQSRIRQMYDEILMVISFKIAHGLVIFTNYFRHFQTKHNHYYSIKGLFIPDIIIDNKI